MRVLFSVQPATGHLQPLVPLYRALLARGHAVRVVCASSFVPVAAALGVAAEPLGLDWLRAEAERFFPALREIPADRRYPWVLREIYAGAAARAALPALQALVGGWRPDVIIRDQMEFAAWLVGESCGIAHVSYGYGLGFQEQDRRMAGPALAALRREAGLPPDEALATLFTHLRLEFAPPSYRPPEAPAVPRSHHLRFEPQDGAAALPGWSWPPAPPGADGAPRRRVVASFGNNYNRTPGLLEMIIAALAEEPVDLLVTIGRNRDAAEFGALPPNVRLVQYAPLSRILPQAEALICHAGFNTIMTAAQSLTPMVLVPIDSDQPAQALRCEALGLGRLLDRATLSPATIRAALRDVLAQPAYRNAVAAFRDEMRRLPDAVATAALLERIGTGSPEADRLAL
jgi:UDP:flavonoid glycosyltransferase YjiC (YdhE family)